MPIEVLMPALSPTMTKGKLIKWCVNINDTVNIGDVVAEVETDKATMEVEAFDEGKIGKVLIEAGTSDVPVNTTIAVILLDGETIEDWQQSSPDSVIEEKEAAIPNEDSDKKTVVQQPKEENQEVDRIKISPLAKRLAQEHNLDVTKIKVGSGPYGRIIKQDVLDLQNQAITINDHRADCPSMPSFSEVSTMRAVIAERLVASKQNVPHFYLTVDCRVDSLLDVRRQINATGHQVTVNDFIVKATALALKKFPAVNSAWHGDKLEHYQTIDVAIAVSLDEGLITPIVANADHKALSVLSPEIKSLVRRAKEGKLMPNEYQGGGITISNLGMFGVKDFIAIINTPQASILAVGTAEKRPVVMDDKVAISTMMTMTLSVDHRVIDGALAAQFLGEVKQFLENPLSVLV